MTKGQKILAHRTLYGCTYSLLTNWLPKLAIDVEMMNFFELNRFIVQEQNKGSEFIDYYLLERQRRMANPISNIILALIAVPLAGRKVRGGVGLHIGIGIGISFSFVMLMQLSSVFATEGGVNPALSAWIPNLIYFFVALGLIYKAPK